MTREQFIQLVNNNGGGLNNDTGSRTFPGLRLSVALRQTTPCFRFYSDARFDQSATLYGPWLGNQLLHHFATNDFNVSVPNRRQDENIIKEGSAAIISLRGVAFGENTENDERIQKFGVTFARFLTQVFGEAANPSDARARYNDEHNDFVNQYAERRQTTRRGLSREELANCQLNDADNQQEPLDDETEQDMPATNPITDPRNLIYFGAPGTGKSHKLNEAVKEKFEDRYERVTFYPTYSYAQFVGCYKPVMKTIDGKEEIAYEFVPGPFLRLLVNSLKDLTDQPTDSKDHSHDHCLVIEEINRANAAAVFGDVFQLLDRPDGESEYDVAASKDVKRYLKKELDGYQAAASFLNVKKDEKSEWTECRIRIPQNMYIWATMNSADQGVFPMDTAFKRRWEFDYIDIDNGENDCVDWTIGDKGYKWNDVRKLINRLLSLRNVNEDKLMGPFFVKPENGGQVVSTNQFKSKVLMYLWEDAARMCRHPIFGNKINTYSELTKAWIDNGIELFKQDTNLGDAGNHEAKHLYEKVVNATNDNTPSGATTATPDANAPSEPPTPNSEVHAGNGE